jgi:uncharacterized integral membrane protein
MSFYKKIKKLKLSLIFAILIFLIIFVYIFQYLSVKYGYPGIFWGFFRQPLVIDIKGHLLSGTIAALIIWIFLSRDENIILRETMASELGIFKNDFIRTAIEEASKNPNILKILGAKANPKDLVQTALAVHLNDANLAEKAYDAVFAPFIKDENLVRNQLINIKLTEAEGRDPENNLRAYFLAYVSMRYSIKLTKPRFIFRCSSDYDIFVNNLKSDTSEFAWNIPEIDHIYERPSAKVFFVSKMCIDGKMLQVTHNYEKQYLIFAEGFDNLVSDNQLHEIVLEFETLLDKKEHILFLSAMHPTINWTVGFDCSEANVDRKYVFAIDNLVSVRPPQYTYFPNKISPTSIHLRIQDWVLPKGGVTFVWGLPS